MAVSKFQSFGVRRDKDLKDLQNAYTALANILDDLSIDSLGFIPEDLNVIKGLKDTDITVDQISEVNDIIRQYSPSEGGSALPLTPLITIQDNINNYKILTESPASLTGGLGPNTYFYPEELIANSTVIADAFANNELTFDTLITGNTAARVGPVSYWDSGYFLFDDKLHPTFRNDRGLILWEGYLNDVYDSIITTTGFLLVEQDQFDDGNWTLKSAIYQPTREVTIDTVVWDGTFSTVTISESDTKVVGKNDYITNKSSGIQIAEIVTSKSFTVESDITGSYANGATLPLEFDIGAGDELTTFRIPLFKTANFDRIKTRIAMWWPDPDDHTEITVNNYGIRSANFSVRNNLNQFSSMSFFFLYSEPFEANVASSSFREFFEGHLNPKAQTSNSQLDTSGKLILNYEPNLQFANNLQTTSATINAVSKGLGNLFTANGTFADVEVGDWAVFYYDSGGSTEYYSSQIEQVINTANIIINKDDFNIADANTNIPLLIFKNNGLIGLYRNEGSGVISELQGGGTALTEAKVDNLIGGVVYGDLVTDFSSINTNMLRLTGYDGNGNISSTEDFQGAETLPSSGIVAVYAQGGLLDYSRETQCVGVYGKEVTSLVAANTNQITVSNTNGISTGDYVQFGDPGTIISLGTTVASVTNSTVFVLSDNTLDEIPNSATITLIESAQGDPGATSKEFCVLPLNTAPPFEGSANGLSTTSSFPDLEVNILAFNNLFLDIDTGNISDSSGITEYTEYLELFSEEANTTYKLIIR